MLPKRGALGRFLSSSVPPISLEQRKRYGKSDNPSPKQCAQCLKRGGVDQSKRYNDYIYRRYRCICGHRWTTYEAKIDEPETPGENNLIEDLRLNIAEHIQTCQKCTPFAACGELWALYNQLVEEDLKYNKAAEERLLRQNLTSDPKPGTVKDSKGEPDAS